MYENIFKRIEIKYLLSEEQKKLLLKKINKYLKKDKYYQSTICNIYFDNLNNDLIINSLEKPIFKEKIRLRSYEIPTLDSDVFLEVKSKYKGIVGKRRIKLTLKDFYNYQEHHTFKDDKIMKEINYYFEYHHLVPAIFIAYDRICFRDKDDENLRITLDNNLRSRHNDLKLELGDHGTKYFDKDYYIMEIKTINALPLWLTNTLSELKIYPTSFSKYGKIYEKENKPKEDINYA